MPIMLTTSQSQFAYDALVQRAKCDSSSDTLACLRKLSATDLQAINTNVAFPGGAGSPPLYMYSPTIDGDFVTDYTYSAFAQGKFVRVPAIYGDDTNEGTIFAPRNTDSQTAAHTFLKNQFPDLTDEQLSKLDSLYPVADYPSPDGAGKWWQQLSAVYGDMRYICPGLFLSNTYGKNMVPNWNYLWDVLPKTPDNDGKSFPNRFCCVQSTHLTYVPRTRCWRVSYRRGRGCLGLRLCRRTGVLRTWRRQLRREQAHSGILHQLHSLVESEHLSSI